jgi:hypothetical protein
MNRISGKRLNVPVNSRLVTTRVVSCGISDTNGETSGSSLQMHKHHGLAPVELFEHGVNAGLPSHLDPDESA